MNTNLRERDYFQNARAQPDPGTLQIGPPFTALTGNWVITLSMTILSHKGKFDGIVAARLDDEALYRAKHQGRNRVISATANT
jgi:hypothetical protein